ncbi:MAG TPA: hypothetical protein DCQ64_30105 [Candidatus Rokubacteria bacterium]|nr:hypothetical protein [Candidatus Rokubacteria bacterium]
MVDFNARAASARAARAAVYEHRVPPVYPTGDCCECGHPSAAASTRRDVYAALTRRGGPNLPHTVRYAARATAGYHCIAHLVERARRALVAGRDRCSEPAFLAVSVGAPARVAGILAEVAAQERAARLAYLRGVLARYQPGSRLYQHHAERVAALEAATA